MDMSRTTKIYGLAIILWVSSLFVGAAFANLPVTAKLQESVTDYCRRAQELLAQEKFQDAREAALHALDIDSHSAEAECLLGMAEFGLENVAAAGEDLQKALELNPSLFAAHRTLGEIYLKQKRLNEARRQFERALASNPDDSESLYQLGVTLLLLHQAGPAENELEKALKAKPRELAILSSLLQAQLELKQEAQAGATVALLNSQLDKHDPRRVELAATLVDHGAYQLAIQQFRRLLETDPESFDLNYNLALAYHRAGEDDQAAALLSRLLAHQESAELENLLGDVEQGRGNRPRSLVAFRRAAELEPHNEEYRYDYAQSLAASSLLNEALEAFKGATRDFPDSVRMWLGWGATYYLAGNYAEAARTLLHGADVGPQSPRAYYLLGRAFDAAGPIQSVITRRFADYLAQKPNDAWAEYFYGRILVLRGRQSSPEDLAEAQRHLERAIALDARLAEAHAELGSLLELTNQFGAARRELERAVDLDPKSSTSFYKLAGFYRRTGESEREQKALAKFQELKTKERASKDREAMSGFLKPSGE